MRWFLQAVKKLKFRHAAIYATLSFVTGQVLNIYWQLNNLLVYQILCIPAVILAFAETKSFLEGVIEFRTMIASHPNRKDGEYIQSLLYSYWYFAALLPIWGLFAYSSFELKYATLDPMGIYAFAMLAPIMISAVLGMMCYIYYLLLLRCIACGKKFNYNFYLPARTNWIQLVARIGVRLNNAFFILGFIYTLVYFLNVKSGYLKISLDPLKIEISTPNDILFIASWIALFVIVIVAFPIYAWLRATYLKRIIRDLKDFSIEEINFLVSSIKGKSANNQETEVKYYRMMMDIDASANSPIENINIIPIVATISSIAVHVIKISESF